MNRKIVTLIMAVTLPLTVAAFPGGGDSGRFHGHRGDRLERLAEKLDLTDEQKSKVEVIFKEQREKFKAIREETRARMQEVLTPEQMTQLDELKKRRHEKWQKRHEEWKSKKQSEESQD